MKNAVEWLLDLPQRHASRVFLVDSFTGREWTYAQYDDIGRRVGAWLAAAGLKPGDRIALSLHNSADFAHLYLGCLYARLVTVPVNPILGRAEADYIIRSSGARALLLAGDAAPKLPLAEYRASGLRVWSLGGAAPADAEAVDLAALPAAPAFRPLDGASPDDTLCIVYTSGTTAKPKGVAHRISDMIDNARMFARKLGIGPQNRFYGILSMTYLGGYYNLLLLPYAAEASVVLASTFDAKSALRFWEPAQQYGVNTLWLVPTIMSILMEVDRGQVGEQHCRAKVILTLCGTAPLPPPLRHAFEKRYAVKVLENYALSETFFLTSNTPGLPVQDGCVGKVLPGIQIRIVDDQGRDLEFGAEGEVQVCTPYLMEGYFNAERQAVDLLDRDGWFPTGDVGVLRPNGDLYITGRKKDLIIRGGINISPASIEHVLQAQDGILEAAVVGIPHALYGEDVVAVVRMQEGADREAVKKDAARKCAEQLGRIRQPAHFLEIDAFPKTSNGKIKKDQVRAFVATKLSLPASKAPSPAAAKSAPIIRGSVVRQVERVPAEVLKALAAVPTSIASDVLNRLFSMDGRLQPVVRGRPFAGSAVTVEEAEGGNLMSHAALELLQPGDVLVIDAKGAATRSCWGGVQTRMAKQRGAVAVVVNGYVRDYDDVVQCGLPVYALGVQPGGPLKGWGGFVNRPVACAGVVVCPGDAVLGDDDGVVVVPREWASRLPALCAARQAMEKDWVQRVEAGEATLDVVGLREQLEKLGIRYE